MTWPTPEEFQEAVQFPATNIRDPRLSRGTVEVDKFGLPRVSSGTFASVYRVHCDEGDYAFRCFLSPAHERADRYKALTDFIIHDDLECTLDFEYAEEGVLVRGKWFPIVKMPWVEGVELDQFIHANVSDSKMITALAEQFARMMRSLHDAGIAHADLQHGNIIVTAEGLRLVDYDGMFVPALKGRTSNELGHRNYQHPNRSDEHFGPYLDHFSAWLIYMSLMCVAHDASLWRGLRDCLIFAYDDLIKPERSIALSVIEHHSDDYVRECGRRLRHLLQMEPAEVPPLHRTFEIEKLTPLLAPNKLREQIEKEMEEELMRPAPPVVHALTPAQRKKKEENPGRLKVTSEVKYLGMSMGVSEVWVITELRKQNRSLKEAGRDVLRRVSWYDAGQQMIGDFEWHPYFGFSFQDGEEVLVKVTGHIDPALLGDFKKWALTTYKGLWVTDGTSRFQFWEDSGRVTYELARYKPRSVKWNSNFFWDWVYDDPSQLHLRRRGRYQIPRLRPKEESSAVWKRIIGWDPDAGTPLNWGTDLTDWLRSRLELYGQQKHGVNALKIRAAASIDFGSVPMSSELRFVHAHAHHNIDRKLLYQIIFDVPPSAQKVLMQNLIAQYGHFDSQKMWADNCATPWTEDNTTMQYVENSRDDHKLIVTYKPLEQLVDDDPVSEKIAKLLRRYQAKKIQNKDAEPDQAQHPAT